MTNRTFIYHHTSRYNARGRTPGIVTVDTHEGDTHHLTILDGQDDYGVICMTALLNGKERTINYQEWHATYNAATATVTTN